MGEHGRGDDGRILDAHPVVDLEFLFEAAQNGDGVVHRRFSHHHGAEPPRQCRVLFHVLLVLGERGGSDAAQVTPRQGRFQQVGCVNRAFRGARAHQRMQLIDEAQDLAIRVDDFLHYRLQPVFELAAEFRARNHRAQIQRHQLLVLELIRHVAPDDALGEALHDGGLAHARLADQHRVVLGAAAQHLHHAADFVFAPDHRVELPLPRRFRQVVRVPLQRLVLGFRILISDALRSAHRYQRLQDGIVGRARALQQLAGGVAALFRDCQQQVLGGNKFVLEARGFVERPLQRLVHGRRKVQPRLHAGRLGQDAQQMFGLRHDRVRMHAAFLQQRTRDPSLLLGQRHQQMQREQHLAFVLLRDRLSLLQGLLRFLRQFV